MMTYDYTIPLPNITWTTTTTSPLTYGNIYTINDTFAEFLNIPVKKDKKEIKNISEENILELLKDDE